MVLLPRPELTSRGVVGELLASFEYDIEFNGYLANHVKHAVIALAGLDATDAKIRDYWRAYCDVTPYGLTVDATSTKTREVARGETPSDEALLTRRGVEALIGEKRNFSWLCNFFTHESRRLGGAVKVVEAWLPHLIDGLPASLTHGIIHLGWGLAARSEWMTIEGLAYLTFTHVSVRPDRFVAATRGEEQTSSTLLPATPFDSLVAIAETGAESLATVAREVRADPENKYPKTSFHPELVPAGFQWEVAKVLDAGHPLFYAEPPWLSDKETHLPTALEQLYEAVCLLHVVGKGNFLILHLITSLWGLEQALDAVDAGVALRTKALRCFWTMTLALITTSADGWPAPDTLRAVRNDLSSSSSSKTSVSDGGFESKGEISYRVDAADDADVVADWQASVDRALNQVEEHNIKLVYVTRDLWHRFGRKTLYRRAASLFTDTPNIGPSQTAFKA